MFLWLAPWPIRKSIRFSNSFSRWLLLCYCYDFAPKNFMFQWIDEVSATPPYQLMADGDQATRIAAERVWPNIKLLMCYVHVRWKTFFLHQIIIYAFLCRRAVRRKFAPIVFQSLLKDLHTLHLYAVDLEAFCLLYGLFQVMKILLHFRTKLQQCNFFSGNGWRMPLIPLPPDTTATRRWRNY